MMRVIYHESAGARWREFVQAEPTATMYHQAEWASVLQRGAGHSPAFLAAEEAGEVAGVLPLALVEGRLFGRFLVSLPHYMGGLATSSEAAAAALLAKACELARELRASSLELRGDRRLAAAQEHGFALHEHKASFRLDLAGGEGRLWESLRKQTRNRVRRGERTGLAVASGPDLLKAFWEVYSENMRAIGSPTFGLGFFGAVLEAFPSAAQVLVAHQEGRPVAAKLAVGFRDTLALLWGGTTAYGRECGANYYLTWQAIRHALGLGYRILDFGRSTIGSGPYRFKTNWGGEELRHHWYVLNLHGAAQDTRSESPRFRMARRVWRRLPLPLTRWIGPRVAEQIP